MQENNKQNTFTPIEIKVGARYITREGLITDPIEKSKCGTSYVWGAWVQEPEYKGKSYLSWLVTGKALTTLFDYKHDLIAKV